MKTARLIQAAAIAALFASGAASAAATNIIVNGDFESYTGYVPNGGYTLIAAGSNAISGWTVGGVSVDLIKNSYGSVSGTSVDMLGTPGPGVLSQAFNYAANTTYTLSFDVSRNPNGSYTAVQVDVNGIQNLYVGTGTPTNHSFTFTTGNSAGSQLLTFSSVGGDGYSGAVLDNVSLTAAVPEPETYAMLVAGLGLLGFVARRRKQA
ncbi:choice-of-anchor C domain-containing protein [Duganella sacchari]|uniref:Choice-of-anchor C domain-containing protein n=1 Tax=Duganella sacchari TaxID=551987 RepID=A0A1M7HET3_9BURK|nr:FxDxF family PEP-CTERM protein [Duganella sacchari]SHM26995.1 choice-of-anchor C domain-containing protein [Duganella sacchari]